MPYELAYRTIELCIVARSAIDNIHQMISRKPDIRYNRKAIIIDKEKNLIQDLIEGREERKKKNNNFFIKIEAEANFAARVSRRFYFLKRACL